MSVSELILSNCSILKKSYAVNRSYKMIWTSSEHQKYNLTFTQIYSLTSKLKPKDEQTVYVNWPSYIPTPLKKHLYTLCAKQQASYLQQKHRNDLICSLPSMNIQSRKTTLRENELSNIYEKRTLNRKTAMIQRKKIILYKHMLKEQGNLGQL